MMRHSSQENLDMMTACESGPGKEAGLTYLSRLATVSREIQASFSCSL
jgi:hypothetical protein